MKSRDEQLLREAVRQAINEEFYDYGVNPWFGPYGMPGASKHSKASNAYGVPGGSLYGIFIKPFVDAAKVVGSELGQTGVRVVALLRTAIESVLEALLPKFKAHYDKIQADEQKLIDKIKEKYADAYKAVDEAWEHEDIQFFAFMHDPTTFLTYKMITAKPQAALSVYEMLAEGNGALLNYLRDIRNRLYGAQAPGAPVPMAQPVAKTEGRVLREGDKVQKKVNFQGLDIHIDRPEGFVQKGTDKDGEEWEREYLFDYGFIKGTEGGDDEDLDVYVGPDEDATDVYLVTQKNDDGEFDEYKAFIGFGSEDEALAAYEAHAPMKYFESVCSIPIGALKGMLGLDPDVDLSEATIKPNVAKAAKQKSPAEQVAAALTDPKFLKMVHGLPKVQQMSADAVSVDKQTGAQLQRAMAPVLNADTAEDLARASGGSWQVPQEFAKLEPEAKAEADAAIVKQAKASMATYFTAQLEALVKELLSSGVGENSPYVQSLRQQISNLAKYKG